MRRLQCDKPLIFFTPLEVVDRVSETQLQVSEKFKLNSFENKRVNLGSATCNVEHLIF